MIQLRDYQVDIRDRAVGILKAHGMVYLAMEVRTGKTLTSLAIAQEYGAAEVLFVTKKKAVSDIRKQHEAMERTFELEVVNYESLHLVDDKARFDFVILDEAHCLAQYPKPSERTKALKAFLRDRPVVYLSGTPTPESYSQIFHQLWVSMNSPFKHATFYQWAKDFVDVRTKHYYNREVPDYSRAKTDLVMERCGHLFISFTQEEAGFEAVVEEEIISVPMKPSTYRLIDRLRIDRVLETKDGLGTVVADTEAKLMQKLHQMYSGTVIIDEPERKGAILDHSKVRELERRFRGQKVAVFYKFVQEEMMLRMSTAAQWAATPEEFNATGPEKWYLTQIISGREGINLSAADALVMLNIDHAAVSYWQARARLQTKDRVKEAKVYWLFAEDGIEFKIHEAVMDKKDYTLSHFRRDYLKTPKNANPRPVPLQRGDTR